MISGSYEDVVLTKENPTQSLGLSIVGGCDHFCHPFGTGERGVYVSKIVPDSLAAQSGRLRVGDRVEKVNGTPVADLSHQQVVQLMIQAGSQLTLHVFHETLPKVTFFTMLFQFIQVTGSYGNTVSLKLHMLGHATEGNRFWFSQQLA